MAVAHMLILGLGGLLVLVPIVLHLLMRPKPKVIKFPALRFVKEMHSSNQRSLNLRHWLLLLLRCLVLLAVAAAFAKPSTVSSAFGNWLGVGVGGLLCLLVIPILIYALVWSKPANLPLSIIAGAILALLITYTGYTLKSATSEDSSHILADQQAPVGAVILVDNSPRMSFRRENQTLLEKVQDQALWLIKQMPLSSKVAVMEIGDDYPFFSVDVSAAQKRVETLDINYAAEPISGSLELAIEFLVDSDFERKELYLFTDLSESAWIDTGDDLQNLLEQHPDVALFILDSGVEDPQNFSLGALRLSASSIPVNGELQLETEIRSKGPGAELLLKMYLEKPDLTRPVWQDGETLVPEEYWTRITNVKVGDDTTTPCKLILQDELVEGVHHGWVEIEGGDSLEVDDRRFFTIDVQPSWPVLIAHPYDVTPYNLSVALETAGGMFNVRTVPQDKLAGEPLSDYSAVFLLDPRPIPDALWTNILQPYVEAGGSLALFLGANALSRDKQPDESFRSEAATRVLPGPLGRDWFRKQGDRFLSMENLSHPIFSAFRSQASRGIWQPFPIYRHWEMDIDPNDPDVQIVARFTDGVGAILQRDLGEGRVICMTTPITEPVRPENRESWNELFNSGRGKTVWPAVLLVSEIAEYLASSNRDRINLSVEQSVTLFNDINVMPSEYRLFSPRDEEPVRVASAENFLRYKFTDTPGTYRLKGKFNDQTVLRGFSTNMSPDITNLTRVDLDDLTNMLGEDRFQLAREREELVRQQGTTRLGQEFYPVLALSLGLLLALELIMSNRFYKKVG